MSFAVLLVLNSAQRQLSHQLVRPGKPGCTRLGQAWACPCGPLPLQALLTLFTESFSQFDHSTCALSVQQLYSALPGKHQVIDRAAIPRSSTREHAMGSHRNHSQDPRVSHPVSSSHSSDCCQAVACQATSMDCALICHPATSTQQQVVQLNDLKAGSFKLAQCLFIRHYWGHHSCVPFLLQLICLS